MAVRIKRYEEKEKKKRGKVAAQLQQCAFDTRLWIM